MRHKRGPHQKSTRRVKDILTPLGAAPHPPRSLALSRLVPACQVPTQAAGDITLPDIPHIGRVSRNNGKKEPGANFPLSIDVAHIPRGEERYRYAGLTTRSRHVRDGRSHLA